MSRRGGGNSGGNLRDFMRRDNAQWLAQQRAINDDSGGWSPSGGSAPQVGFVRNDTGGEDHLVSFKQGYGDREGQTLISDGNLEDDKVGFDAHHNHYGPKREGGGDFSVDRGHYTGPGA